MMIELRGINKTYNNGAPLHVLKGIDLDVALWVHPALANPPC